MPTLADILGLAPKPAPTPPPDFDPARPWESPSLAAPPLQPAPAPTPNPYVVSAPDPWAQAAHLAERQQAAAGLSSPVTPVLEVPASLMDLLIGLLPKRKPEKK